MKKLATNLRRLREERGLTQKQLSTKSGVPQPSISGIENATTISPAYQTVLKLANALDATYNDLASGRFLRDQDDHTRMCVEPSMLLFRLHMEWQACDHNRKQKIKNDLCSLWGEEATHEIIRTFGGWKPAPFGIDDDAIKSSLSEIYELRNAITSQCLFFMRCIQKRYKQPEAQGEMKAAAKLLLPDHYKEFIKHCLGDTESNTQKGATKKQEAA